MSSRAKAPQPSLLPYRRMSSIMLAGLSGLVCSYAVTSPDGHPLKLLLLLIGLMFAIALPGEIFIAGTLLAFAVSTAVSSSMVPALPIPVYFSDFIVLLVAVRGILPRDRLPSTRPLAGAPTIVFVLWMLVMAVAAVRAINDGVRYPSAIRGDLALVYWPLLYFGFTRILRESRLRVSSLWRNLGFVALALAGWMLLARAINHPFHDSGLAQVATGSDSYVRRNFGFAGAFIIYPALALVAVAELAYGGTRRPRWTIIAGIGALATLLTFVRGEIFSFAIAFLVILAFQPQLVGNSARVRTAVQLSSAVAAAVFGLMIVNPTLGEAVVQRAVPFTHQSAGAEANAEFRQRAVETGFRIAQEHPAGLGVLDVERLDAERIDRGFLAHSGVATLLLVGGWPAFCTGLLAIFSVMARSFSLPAATNWLHPAFVAVLAMLSIYSISAAGLAGDPWVMPLGVLAVALRFTLAPLGTGRGS